MERIKIKKDVWARMRHQHRIIMKREYTAWKFMRLRCYNPQILGYRNYGGRGIKVCSRWKNNFRNFYADMGPRPEKTVLRRIDENNDFSPENCKWG